MISLDQNEVEEKSLGALLREARETKGLGQDALADDTKISPLNLEAMEGNNYSSLPSRAFSRGFYRLYAQAVDLDAEEILARFDQQFGQNKPFSRGNLPPTVRARKLENMAERPVSGSMFSWVLLALLILLMAGGFLSWYFSWNPASYLSEKLRSFDTGPASNLLLEGQVVNPLDRSPAKDHSDKVLWPLFSSPSLVQPVYARSEPDVLDSTELAKPPSGFSISATFHEQTNLSLSVDGEALQNQSFVRGESAQWLAEKRFILSLPGNANLSLSLNNRPVTLPHTTGKPVTIILPDDIL